MTTSLEYNEDVIEVGDIVSFRSVISPTLTRYAKVEEVQDSCVIMRGGDILESSKFGPFTDITIVRPIKDVTKLKLEELI